MLLSAPGQMRRETREGGQRKTGCAFFYMRARRERGRGKGRRGETKSFWWVDNETKCAGGWIDGRGWTSRMLAQRNVGRPDGRKRGGRSKSQGEEEKVEEGPRCRWEGRGGMVMRRHLFAELGPL